jgi:serine/threonine protein kinase
MTVSRGKRAGIALVVGISRYLHDGIAPLDLAVPDARAVFRILTDPDICNFPPENVVLLTDEEASRDALVERLSTWLPEQGQGQDIALLYYAGHGTVKRLGGRDEGYLLPHDANPDKPATRGVAMSDVSRWIEAVEAKSIVLCLDCCHAAKAIARAASGPAVPRALGLRPSALPELSGGGHFLLAACGENQYSLESPQFGHGLFTYYLLEGLKGKADENRDGKVGVAELFEYVAREVGRESMQTIGQPQTPWFKATNAGGVYLAEPRLQSEPTVTQALDDLWDEDRPRALRQIEQLLPNATEETLRPVLRLLRARPDPVALPVLFRCLAMPVEGLQQRARLAIDAVGWTQTVLFIEEQARRGASDVLGSVLDGLATFEASPDLVALLDRLEFLLRDQLRERAQHLLGRKRLGLELEKTKELFQQHHSPYELLRVLGQGTLAAAYLARHRETDVEAVVRVLRPELASQPAVRAQFQDMARRSHPMVHQSLVRVFEVRALQEHNIYYIIRDYVTGATLQKFSVMGKRFEPPQVLHIMKQLAGALTPWHKKGFTHGGVKPSNIFVCDENRVVLGDASLPVRDLLGKNDNERTAYDFRYAAPETIQPDTSIGPPADLYSLGCVVYELLCGQPPFVSDNVFKLAQYHSDLPPTPPANKSSTAGAAIDDLVLRLLNKAPAGRFATAEEVLMALEELRHPREQDRPQPSIPPSHPPLGPPEEQENAQDTLSGEIEPERPAAGLTLLPGRLLEQASLQRYVSFASMPAPDAAALSRYEAASTSRPELIIPGYAVLGELGRGGMGVVYKAKQLKLNRVVALKMILAGVHADAAHLTRFRTEAEAVARLQHPNFVQVFEVGEHGGVPFLSLEYCPGGSLARKLDSTPLPPREAAGLVEQLARAMQAAHDQQVIHRDLKPANVLLAADGTPKITDFGLAKKLDDASGGTLTGAVMGTPSYMAPEQASGNSWKIGPAVDIYALGAILYECVTGRPPFRAASVIDTLQMVVSSEPVPPRQLNGRTPRDLETICLKCLQKEAARRYDTAKELADDLERWLRGEPVLARPSTSIERLFKFIRRRPAVAALVALLVLTVLTSSAVIFLLLTRLQSPGP